MEDTELDATGLINATELTSKELEGMYDEVVNYYLFDLGELSKKVVDRINVEMTSTTIDRKIILGNVIRKLYVLLLNGNNNKINEKFNGLGAHTIELHDINQKILEIDSDLKKPQHVLDLKRIYLEKQRPLILLASDKIRIENNKRKLDKKEKVRDTIINIIINMSIAIIFFLLGYYLKK